MEEKTEDICPQCRIEAMVFSHQTWRITHVKQWCTLWLYRGNVRDALIRFKFMRRPGYGSVFGRELAEKLKKENYSVDVITWVPTGFLRKRKRTYDQVELIAREVAWQLELPVEKLLRKTRNNRKQSTLRGKKARALLRHPIPHFAPISYIRRAVTEAITNPTRSANSAAGRV